MIKRLAIIFILLCGMSLKVSLRGGLARAGSQSSVSSTLARSPYSVVLFYERSKDAMRDPVLRNKINDLEDMMNSLSKNPDYKAADLLFMRIDVARRNYEAMLREYQIDTLPAIRFFLGDQMVGGLNGFVHRAALQTQIDTYFKEPMQRTLREKAHQRKREFERAQINAAYWAPYWGPYWAYGYYPYWNGPTFGGAYGFYNGW